jgi:hypothetical protein
MVCEPIAGLQALRTSENRFSAHECYWAHSKLGSYVLSGFCGAGGSTSAGWRHVSDRTFQWKPQTQGLVWGKPMSHIFVNTYWSCYTATSPFSVTINYTDRRQPPNICPSGFNHKNWSRRYILNPRVENKIMPLTGRYSCRSQWRA